MRLEMQRQDAAGARLMAGTVSPAPRVRQGALVLVSRRAVAERQAALTLSDAARREARRAWAAAIQAGERLADWRQEAQELVQQSQPARAQQPAHMPQRQGRRCVQPVLPELPALRLLLELLRARMPAARPIRPAWRWLLPARQVANAKNRARVPAGRPPRATARSHSGHCSKPKGQQFPEQ